MGTDEPSGKGKRTLEDADTVSASEAAIAEPDASTLKVEAEPADAIDTADTLAEDGDHATVSEDADTLGGETARRVTATSSGPPLPAQFAEGEKVGRYLVVRLLGKGGMGVVLAAYDPTLDRRVALKLLRTKAWGAGASDAAKKRLLREAQAMAKLSHPNVVVVHEVGTVGGRVFVAMEYVEGGTLREWCKAETRSWRELLDVFSRAGRGLIAAHEAGLVHRDFKPENVLVGKDGRVRVTDFGLVSTAGAVAVDEDEPSSDAPELSSSTPLSTTLTRTGSLLGTPIYMAPEQHHRRKADARADQFAFCVALYEALYGKRPFGGGDYWRLAANVCEGKLREPSRDSEVPTWIRDVVCRGLERDPEDRYPSMKALLADLDNDPAVARRRRVKAVAIGAVIAGLAGVAAFGLLRDTGAASQVCKGAHEQLVGVWDEGRKAAVKAAFLGSERSYAEGTYARVEARLDEYARSWVEARTQACEATHVHGEQSEAVLDLRIGCLDRRLGEARALVDLFAEQTDTEVLDKAILAAAKLGGLEVCADREALASVIPAPSDPEVRAKVDELRARLDRATALENSGKYAASLEIAEAVVEEAEPTGFAPLQAEALYRVASLHRTMGKAKQAEASLRAAIEKAAAAQDDVLTARIWTMLVYVVGNQLAQLDEALKLFSFAEAAVVRAGEDDMLRADLDSSLGLVYYRQGKYDDARNHLERALELLKKARGDDHPDVARGLNNLGVILFAGGKDGEALDAHERALVIWEAAFGPDHPRVAVSLQNLGNALHRKGKLDDARAHYERALAISEKALGPDHPDVAATLNNLGALFRKQGKYDEARQLLERAVAIHEKARGSEHPDVAGALTNLGTVLLSQGDYAAARSTYERALAIREKALGPEHAGVALTLDNLGRVASRQGKYREAQEAHERAMAIRQKTLGPEHPHMAASLENMGSVLEYQGKLDQAQGYHARGLALREKLYGPDHVQVGIALNNFASLTLKLGRREEALKQYQRAVAIFEKGLGASHPNVASALSGVGSCHVAMSHPESAIEAFERALEIRKAKQGSPIDLASLRFRLARALWDAKQDRKRALALAEEARAAHVESGQARATQLAEVEAWLAARR